MEALMWMLLGGCITLVIVGVLRSLFCHSTLREYRTLRKLLLKYQYDPSVAGSFLNSYKVDLILNPRFRLIIVGDDFQLNREDCAVLQGRYTANKCEFLISYAAWSSVLKCEQEIDKMKEYK